MMVKAGLMYNDVCGMVKIWAMINETSDEWEVRVRCYTGCDVHGLGYSIATRGLVHSGTG